MQQYRAHTATAVALVANTVQTLLQIVTPSTRRARLLRAGISFDGVAASDVPVTVDLILQTSGGTASAMTPVALDPADPAALVTALKTFTAEPTNAGGDAIVVAGPWFVTPNGGLWVPEWPQGLDVLMAISTRVGIRAKAPTNAVNVLAHMIWQE